MTAIWTMFMRVGMGTRPSCTTIQNLLSCSILIGFLLVSFDIIWCRRFYCHKVRTHLPEQFQKIGGKPIFSERILKRLVDLWGSFLHLGTEDILNSDVVWVDDDQEKCSGEVKTPNKSVEDENQWHPKFGFLLQHLQLLFFGACSVDDQLRFSVEISLLNVEIFADSDPVMNHQGKRSQKTFMIRIEEERDQVKYIMRKFVYQEFPPVLLFELGELYLSLECQQTDQKGHVGRYLPEMSRREEIKHLQNILNVVEKFESYAFLLVVIFSWRLILGAATIFLLLLLNKLIQILHELLVILEIDNFIVLIHIVSVELLSHQILL